jgi:DNA-binding LacI/PurR family transcriptional regulator
MRRRIEEVSDALDEAGISLSGPQVDIAEAPFSREGGRMAFHKLWKPQDPPTAIITFSDTIALGVMDAARNAGIAIPERLSVTGFDDLESAQWVRPGLTTVQQPIVGVIGQGTACCGISDGGHSRK